MWWGCRRRRLEVGHVDGAARSLRRRARTARARTKPHAVQPVLVLGAAVVVLVGVVVVGEDHVVPQLGHYEPHLPRLQVEKTGFVTYLREMEMLGHLFTVNSRC